MFRIRRESLFWLLGSSPDLDLLGIGYPKKAARQEHGQGGVRSETLSLPCLFPPSASHLLLALVPVTAWWEKSTFSQDKSLYYLQRVLRICWSTREHLQTYSEEHLRAREGIRQRRSRWSFEQTNKQKRTNKPEYRPKHSSLWGKNQWPLLLWLVGHSISLSTWPSPKKCFGDRTELYISQYQAQRDSSA